MTYYKSTYFTNLLNGVRLIDGVNQPDKVMVIVKDNTTYWVDYDDYKGVGLITLEELINKRK